MRFAFLFFCSLFFLAACSDKQPERILILGDSNGAASDGWAVQLQKQAPEYTYCNLSISGNTIGFDNLGRDTLNTLKNLPSYLERARQQMGDIDRVIVWLGSNDCKAVFDSLQEQVPANLDALLSGIEQQAGVSGNRLLLVAPTPYAADSLLEAKYWGGNDRLKRLVPQFEALAAKHQCGFVNLYDSLCVDFPQLNKDGLHLNETGATKAARIISNYLSNN